MAFLFDLKDLVDLMSIGTLLAYTLVAACVLVLRYQPDSPTQVYHMANTHEELEMRDSFSAASVGILPGVGERFSFKALLFPDNPEPSGLSGSIVNICASLLGLLILAFSVLAVLGGGAVWNISTMSAMVMVCLLLITIIWRQPESKSKLSFKVPLLPFLPVFSMFVNVYLMMQLDRGTWVRFALWMSIGLAIYFGYGIRHSSEGALIRSSPDEEADTCKSTCTHDREATSPEKEAFLCTRLEDRSEEDGMF